VECTINGIGERAGNCALEEVVMALRTRHDSLGLRTGIRTERLYPTSRLLSNMTGMHVQRNKAIVGENAFAHESGIHQHGVLMHAGTYEIMKPEDVGFTSNNLVLGKHSGRHLLRERVKELGYRLDEAQLERVFEGVKALADKKKAIYDADVEALIQGFIQPERVAGWELEALSVSCGTAGLASASVSLRHSDGRRAKDGASGDGPVDAVFKTLERITGVAPKLRHFEVNAVGSDEDAQGEISVEVEHSGRRYRARAVNTDIVLGSAHAFLETINRIAAEDEVAARRPNGVEALQRAASQGAPANGKDPAAGTEAPQAPGPLPSAPAFRSTPK
jgi:2-isopropylmalate synthase